MTAPQIEAIARQIARDHDLDPDDARLGQPTWQTPWILAEAAREAEDQARGVTVLEQSEALDGRLAQTVRLADGTETVRLVDDVPHT